jgi:hypothetical protein
MDYDVKKGHGKVLEGDGLRKIAEEVFGSASVEGDMVVSKYGAMTHLEAKVKDKSNITVNTTTDTKASVELAADTIKQYNVFMEKVTGFTSKERRTRLQKKAKEGKL